jgi:hypothetical protein
MNAVTKTMIDFVQSVSISVELKPIPLEKEFVPDVCINYGGLLVDIETLKYPKDILHEAGRLAVVSS